MGLIDRFRHGWNAFVNNRDPTNYYRDIGPGYSIRPDRPRLTRGNERTIITAPLNRIANDAAQVDIKHVMVDENNRYKSDRKSGLNECLNVAANIDQTGRALRLDIFMSLLDEGTIAVVPVDTNRNPKLTDSYDILSLRVGKIVEWFPQNVRVRLYNERTGRKEDIILPKSSVAIPENPFFAVMNEPNSIMQRLVRKLNLLDAIDEQSGSGKLDMIIQLPYSIRSEAKRAEAEKRRQDIAAQLTNSKYGIAYADATEKITQLNRPLENNLLKQIEFLTNMLYSQLGITQAIMDGTADEATMLNYNNRTIEPLVSAVVDAMKMKFLSKTARTQGQSIMYFRDPFKLVPISQMAEIGDKFTRNEIMTSNEIRQGMGMKPSDDPKADQLINSNLNHPDETQQPLGEEDTNPDEGGKVQNGA